jgi:hypothetical protein
VGAGHGLPQRGACLLQPRGAGGELLELAGGELLPALAVSELGDLGEGETHVTQDEDHANLGNGGLVVAALARLSGEWTDETKVVVVAQGADRHPRLLRQLADAECDVSN